MEDCGRLRRVFENLDRFRLSGDLCDVEILVGGTLFQAHKVALAACSEYFQTMFLGGMKEKSQGKIQLHEVSPHVFDQLLKFAYGRDLEISSDNAEDVIIAADMLQFKDAVSLCVNFMKDQVDCTNCIGIFCFAKQHAFNDLQKTAWKCILSNFYRIILEDEFLSTPYEVFDSLVKSEFIAISSETDVMHSVLRWLMHDVPARRKHCVSLLQNVRTNLILPEEIDKMLSTVPDLCLKIAVKVLTQNCPRKARSQGKTMTSNPAISEPRQSAKKSFYAVGGSIPNNSRRYTWEDSSMSVVSFVERFDSFAKSWDVYPLSLHEARTSLAVVTLNRRIYAIGGEKDSMIYGSIECFDTKKKTWKWNLPGLNYPRTACQAVTANNGIYILGGNVGSGAAKSIEHYDTETNECKVMSFQMQTERHSFGAVCVDNVIYMAGGVGLSECELRTMECYDLDRHEWWHGKDMTFKRAYFNLVSLKGTLFAIGGHNEVQGTLKSVEAYDTYKNWWQPCAPMSRARAGAFVSVMYGKIVAVGGRFQVRGQNGEMSWEVLCDAEAYDPKTDSWSPFESMNFDPRCDGVGVII